MHWYVVTYFASIIITFAVMGFIAWYSRRHRDVPGASVCLWLSLMVSMLAFFEGISLIGPTKEWALFWYNIRFLAFVSIPPLWLAFVLHFIGKPHVLTIPRIGALFIIPAATLVMIWTNGMHGLWMARTVGFRLSGPFYIAETASRVPGPWYTVHLIYSFALMMAGVILLFVTASRMFRQSRGQAVALGAGTLIMIMGSLFPAVNLVPGQVMSPMIPIFAVGSGVIAWAVFRYRFLETTPLVERDKPIPLIIIIMFPIISVGITAVGFFYYRYYNLNFREGVKRELFSIVNLKVEDLVRWRAERLGDAAFLFRNDAITSRADRLFNNTSDANNKWRLQTWLGKFRSTSRYDHILILDARGAPRMSFPPSKEPVCGLVLEKLAEIRRTGAITLLDFHRESPDQPIHLSIVVPVRYDRDTAGVLGFFVLFIDPKEYIYPMISRWPVQSRTAETLLVKKDGDAVLFLNELRFRKNTALKLRIPLTDLSVPAVAAVLERETVMEGIDYRDVPVIAAMKAVPGSPWFMVARVDMAEAYAPLRERLWALVVLMGALMLGTASAIGFFIRRQANRFYREQYEAAEKLRESEEKFSLAFRNSSYAITITRLGDGCFFDVNEAFSAITGFTREEALNDSSIGLGLWVDSEDRSGVVRDLMSGRKVAEREFLFRKKNGDIITGLFSAGVLPMKNEPLIVSSINDITERKQAEELAIKAREEALRLYETSSQSRRALLSVVEDQKIAEYRMKKINHEQDALNTLLRMSLENITLEECLNTALDILFAIPWLSVEKKGSIMLVDAESGTLSLIAHRNLEPAAQAKCSKIPIGECICGRAAATGRPLLCGSDDERYDRRLPGKHSHGHYCVPITHEGTVRGVINIYLNEKYKEDDEEKVFLETFASILFGIIDRLRGAEEIRAQLDELRRWHGAILDREDRVLELKREVNDLLVQTGKPVRYNDPDFTVPAAGKSTGEVL